MFFFKLQYNEITKELFQKCSETVSITLQNQRLCFVFLRTHKSKQILHSHSPPSQTLSFLR